MKEEKEIRSSLNTLELARGSFDILEYHDDKLTISGWMLHLEKDFSSFAVYINQRKVGEAAKVEREDVARVFPHIPHAKNSGFSISLYRPFEEIDRAINICIVGISKDREIAKIETWYRYNRWRDELTPSKKMNLSIGGGDFKKIGDMFRQYFIEFGELKPNEKVLDVGCGVGRMAVPLTEYLDKRGSYEGFDIVAEMINWCIEKITPKYPNFNFQLADIYNKHYNPKGRYKASEYKFPYENESFDFVFLTSVFTHMLPQDMENYFYEIVRVLKKDARCLITFFLLNADSLKLIDAKLSPLNFKYDVGGCRTTDKNEPETAISYDESYIRGLYNKYGLNIKEPIYYGNWCGRDNFLSYQDIIIAQRF